MVDSDGFRRAAKHVADDLDSLVDEIFAAVSSVPGYARGRRPGELEDVRSGIRVLVALVLDCLIGGRQPTETERRDIAFLGMQRARQDIPRDSVSQTMDIALRVGFSRLLTAVEVALAAEERTAAVATAWDLVSDLMVLLRQDMLDAYDLESGRPPGGADRRKAAVFLDRLLCMRWDKEADIRSHAAGAGVSIGRRPALVIVVPVTKATQASLAEASASIQRDLPTAFSGGIRWEPVLHLPLLVNCDERSWADVRSALSAVSRHTGTTVVCIEPRDSLRELAIEFRFVQRGIQHAPAARRGPALVDAVELPVLHLFTGSSLTHRLEFVRHELGPVLEHPHADKLLALIDAIYDTDGSQSAAAELVGMAKTTARRRWALLETLTKRSLNRASDRYALFTAVRLHDLLTYEVQAIALHPGG